MTEIVTDAKIPGGRDPCCPSVPVLLFSPLSLNKIFPVSRTVVVSISISRTVGVCRGFWELMQALFLSTKLNGHSFWNRILHVGRVRLNQLPFLLLGGIFLEPVLLSCLCKLKLHVTDVPNCLKSASCFLFCSVSCTLSAF